MFGKKWKRTLPLALAIHTLRSQIDIRKAAKILSIEQVEETLQIIASTNPDKILNPNASNLPLEETEKAYPEFTHLLAIDAKYEHKLFRYLLDFRDYWNNAISLLAVYIQLAVENNDQQRLQRGLDLVKFFRQRIKAQKDLTEKFDAATTDPDVRNQVYGSEYIPSEYHQALLDLTEAEVLSFYKDQKTSFYQAGIDLA